MSAKLYTTVPQVDASPRTILLYDAQAFGNSDVISGSRAVLLLSAMVANKSSTLLWLQFFDSLTVPANTAVPMFVPLPVAANSAASINLIAGPRWAGLLTSTGLSWAASTTAGTLTIDATSSLWVSCQYS